MIQELFKLSLNKYKREVDNFINHSVETQDRVLRYLLKHGINTEYGHEHHFDRITSRDDFRKLVPIKKYEEIYPYIQSIIRDKKQSVLWDTPVIYFAMSSGTTNDKSKYLPVTKESLNNGNYKGGRQMVSMYLDSYKESSFAEGQMLVLGGSRQINRIGSGFYTSDISAILIKNLPFWMKFKRTPEKISLIPDWNEKLERIINYSINQDIRSLAGVPSWILLLLKNLVEKTGREVVDVWPNLEVYFHGGVSFLPFKDQYKKLIKNEEMRYWEVYNASEGYFGAQYQKDSDDLLLLLDNEVYYEFMPVSEWGAENPRTQLIEEVEIGKPYALIISTSSGLWRYNIGDVIQFTSLSPYCFKIIGRTKEFINIYGEELVVDNAVKAIAFAARQCGVHVLYYTAGPSRSQDKGLGRHEWIIEFEQDPSDLDHFTRLLDEELKRNNSDYEAKRYDNLILGLPNVIVVPPKTFQKWLEKEKKLGGQNKVPKLSNSRKYLDSILDSLQ